MSSSEVSIMKSDLLNWYVYGARFYDSQIGRFTTQDAYAEKYLNFSPYQYAANNPVSYIDAMGDSLVKVNMMGLSTEDPVLKNREYYLDSKIAENVTGFVREARSRFNYLSVNNTFRDGPSTQINTKYTKAKGLSRHNAGFAIDLNGVLSLSSKDQKILNKIAAINGLFPNSNQKEGPVHYSSNPTDFGYNSLDQAVNENLQDYKQLSNSESDVKTSAITNKYGVVVGMKYESNGKGKEWINFVNNLLNNSNGR
jgi:RHS repeat-associated protein